MEQQEFNGRPDAIAEKIATDILGLKKYTLS
jgi:hypothetical protein